MRITQKALEILYHDLAELTEVRFVYNNRGRNKLLSDYLDLVNLFLDAGGTPSAEAIGESVTRKFQLE